MGQAGAQREPSMEEILASIRRIIENNEPAADGGHATASHASAQDYDTEHAYSDHHETEVDEADAGNDEPAVQHAEREEPQAVRHEQPVARPVSLAEVAALARSASHQDMSPAAPAFAGQSFVGQASSAPVASVANVRIVAEIDDAASEELRKALTSNEPVKAQGRSDADAGDEDGRHAGAASQTATVRPADHTADAPRGISAAEAPGQPEAGGQLVSLQTGEKVAAAFGELNAALAAGQTRSFDEIAEEMLRPMLTQWLDDNLPTLVERLVREEIERVSRGNRR
ncbi:DUF2497 domain-containing protein [Hoeflea olei]|uniref:Pole-organizing protein PopZ n=1 Tax=Hoeflea olei TaxID=1480615 RepID=A0A1C1YZH6_9HYPH|nr:DUF2497 domain-containing protein [Hoeflea olei]OCW58875.1 hypothetical protein AWJ14_21100 [Hoeflea olei]